jgi:hypothetical protein
LEGVCKLAVGVVGVEGERMQQRAHLLERLSRFRVKAGKAALENAQQVLEEFLLRLAEQI